MKPKSRPDFLSSYPTINKTRKVLPLNEPLTKQDIETVLTFLLSSGAITSKQFVELKNKALPFTKG